MNLDREELISGLLAGAAGSLVFAGFLLAIGEKAILAGAIPALYGISGPSLLAGVFIHLIDGAILGAVYALIIKGTGYGHHLEDVKKATVLGIGYGMAAAVLLAAVLMPVWLSAVGFPKAPSPPNFKPMVLLGHIIYGAVLGAGYPLIRNQLEK